MTDKINARFSKTYPDPSPICKFLNKHKMCVVLDCEGQGPLFEKWNTLAHIPLTNGNYEELNSGRRLVTMEGSWLGWTNSREQIGEGFLPLKLSELLEMVEQNKLNF